MVAPQSGPAPVQSLARRVSPRVPPAIGHGHLLVAALLVLLWEIVALARQWHRLTEFAGARNPSERGRFQDLGGAGAAVGGTRGAGVVAARLLLARPTQQAAGTGAGRSLAERAARGDRQGSRRRRASGTRGRRMQANCKCSSSPAGRRRHRRRRPTPWPISSRRQRTSRRRWKRRWQRTPTPPSPASSSSRMATRTRATRHARCAPRARLGCRSNGSPVGRRRRDARRRGAGAGARTGRPAHPDHRATGGRSWTGRYASRQPRAPQAAQTQAASSDGDAAGRATIEFDAGRNGAVLVDVALEDPVSGQALDAWPNAAVVDVAPRAAILYAQGSTGALRAQPAARRLDAGCRSCLRGSTPSRRAGRIPGGRARRRGDHRCRPAILECARGRGAESRPRLDGAGRRALVRARRVSGVDARVGAARDVGAGRRSISRRASCSRWTSRAAWARAAAAWIASSWPSAQCSRPRAASARAIRSASWSSTWRRAC